jgi:hypothetical protein
MSFGDSLANEIILRLEVSVEPTVGEASVGHETGNACSLDALSPEARRRHVHNPFARLLLMTLLITHAHTSYLICLYTTSII